jgi:hypothetical protein
MSNRVALVSTEFKDTQGNVTYGYRLRDDYDDTYRDSMDALITDDLELLASALRQVGSPADSLCATAKIDGISINDNWYDAADIAHVFEAHEMDLEQDEC